MIKKFLAGVRLGLSLFADHGFWHIFQDCVIPNCSCGQKIDTSTT